ncbi:response regulator [Pseudovibrio exalbescens]|uniref:Regulatory protein VirG n=1 Tax=Pseudovibrio exalbescens TaxID=197461 RepID=A0A1U7JF78_9HYPH|nr:response regulator [Pseudovibrio exalbescens]OKL43342.1 DNA-binding response regulator [Pseudovibrio exalbescens]
MTKVLIVDDDADIRELVIFELQQMGWQAFEASNAEEMFSALDKELPDIILLDIKMPGLSGLEITQRLRATSNIPIIMMTGLGSNVDRIIGLELGADDYVVKPVCTRELAARIKAVLRRTKPDAGESQELSTSLTHDCRRFEGFFVDLSAHILKSPSGREIPLTSAEFSLLAAFLSAPRRVLTRDQLLEITRGHDDQVFDRSIDVLILRLRRKIEPNPHAPRFICTKRGAGYIFNADVETL